MTQYAMHDALAQAINSIATITGLARTRVQIKFDLRDDDPEGGPPMPWTVEVRLPAARKNGIEPLVQGYGEYLSAAVNAAVDAVERHRG